MVRNVAGSLALVAVFAAFAWWGASRWSRPLETGDRDEAPLKVGGLVGTAATHHALMGYKWRPWSDAIARMKKELPPDPLGPDAAKDAEIYYRRLLNEVLKVKMPVARLSWPQVVVKLRENYEAVGVPVSTYKGNGNYAAPETLMFQIPKETWDGFEILSWLTNASQRVIGYNVTSDGLCLGTDEWVKRATLEAALNVARRRVAPELKDKRLDATFRPEFVDATIDGFAKVVEAQTGIEVVVDIRIWEKIPAILWRGEPRTLRDALDELCSRLSAYWRWHDGRVWLLVP